MALRAQEDLQFIPVSIDYEKIIEAGSYARELRREKKKRTWERYCEPPVSSGRKAVGCTFNSVSHYPCAHLPSRDLA